ncbi:hypothetical protein [Polaribacter sp. Hel1_85]|uniref:hypothetical protein n=1 Tax=Polaribacter sp. Hel1_85 TaxID=1250005 RepID=UPI00052B5B4E|nr:hypothetical protein [Polaribacter sp. Hel1_85]KGL62335.1 hypothetical protein PHEL85_2129 [Polaribacter sp. Hel1_85]
MNKNKYTLGFNHGYSIMQEESNKDVLNFIKDGVLENDYLLGLADGKKTALEQQSKIINKTSSQKIENEERKK